MNLHVAKDSSKVNQEMKGRETTASRATWLSWNCTGGQGDQKFHLTWMFLDDVFILMAMIASVGTRWNKAVSDTCMPVVGLPSAMIKESMQTNHSQTLQGCKASVTLCFKNDLWLKNDARLPRARANQSKAI